MQNRTIKQHYYIDGIITSGNNNHRDGKDQSYV